MEYDDSPEAVELADRAKGFMDEVVIPTERDLPAGERLPGDVLADLNAEARRRDLYAPQMPAEYGGQGIGFDDVLPTFEQVGRSLLGPPAAGVAAPDEGNMHLLDLVGTDEQKERWLRPLVAGDLVSAFSMTEPMQGGGADPKMLRTRAERDGDGWVLRGHKWWTTQGSTADVLIVMARTDPDVHPYVGCSLFLVPADTDGVTVVRDIPSMGGGVLEKGHAEIKYVDVRVPEENLLGTVNEGFTHAQQRLGPARLTHCMRFSGMAERSLDILKAYVDAREAFGSTLAEKQAVRHTVADLETNLHAARAMVRQAAGRISSGKEARTEVSMCKLFTARMVQETVDTAVQYCGANGIGRDLPLAGFYERNRAFRIADGADEVHRRVISRASFEDVDPSELEVVARFDESVL